MTRKIESGFTPIQSLQLCLEADIALLEHLKEYPIRIEEYSSEVTSNEIILKISWKEGV